MIAKNIKGKSFGGCVRYVMNTGAELLEAEGVFADSTESIIRSFAMQRHNRSEIKQPVGHIPLSFSPEDKPRMTNDFMLQLAKEYMQEMGIGNTQYIIVRHNNTDHDHVHIVYNRINNDLKLISVNNDYKRNIAVCKKLKDRHHLTYGEGKEKVQRPKLNGADKVKYEIHDAIKKALPTSTDYKTLASHLDKYDITLQLKYRRGTDIIEGVSFAKDGLTFKGSQIDRKFSHKNLMLTFGRMQNLQAEAVKRQTDRPIAQVKPPVQPIPHSKNPKIFGVQLTDEQVKTVRGNNYIYVENMSKDGKQFSSYVATDDQLTKAFLFKTRPDEFVKYGRYEMREMDKRRIEAGLVVKATVKWYGIGNFAHPYLWKANPTDTDYQESWGDPRITEKGQPQANSDTQAVTTTAEAIGKAITDTVQGVSETVSEVASGLGGLFNSNNLAEDPAEAEFRRRMQRKKKKRGFGW